MSRVIYSYMIIERNQGSILATGLFNYAVVKCVRISRVPAYNGGANKYEVIHTPYPQCQDLIGKVGTVGYLIRKFDEALGIKRGVPKNPDEVNPEWRGGGNLYDEDAVWDSQYIEEEK